MNTAGSKVDLKFSLRLQVFWIKLDLMILLLSFGFRKQWVAEIVVMKVKRRLIVPIPIGLHDLTVGNLGILDQDVDVRAAFSIGVANKPFDREPMVSFVRCRYDRREPAQSNCSHEGHKNTQPQLNPRCPVTPHVCDVAAFLSVSFRQRSHATKQPA